MVCEVVFVEHFGQCLPGRFPESGNESHPREGYLLDQQQQHHHHHHAAPVMHPDLPRHATANSDHQHDALLIEQASPLTSGSSFNSTAHSSPFQAQAELLRQKLLETKRRLDEMGYLIPRRLPSLISFEDDAGDDSSNIVVSSGGFSIAEPRTQLKMPHENEYKLVAAVQLSLEWTRGLGCQWEPAIAREPAVNVDFAIMQAERAREMEWFNGFASA